MTRESVPTQPSSEQRSLSRETWQAVYAAVPHPVFVCLPDEQGSANRILAQNTAAEQQVQEAAHTSANPDSDAGLPESIGHVLTDPAGDPIQLRDGDAGIPALISGSNGQQRPVKAGCGRVSLEGSQVLVVTAAPTDGSTRSTEHDSISSDHLVDEDYRRLLEIFQIPVTVMDKDCRIILMNPAGAANLQMTPQQVVGKYFREILPEFGDQTQQRVNEVLASRKRLTFEDAVTLHDGIRWFRSVMQPMEGVDGRRLVWAVSYEFTEERETQAALTETNERIRSLAANIPGAIFQLAQAADGQLRIPYLGHALAQFLGPAEADARNNPRVITKVMHPEDRKSFRVSFMRSIRQRTDWRWEGRFLDDDDIRWMQAAARVRTSPEGEVLWDGVVMDVTDTHRLDESLQTQEQQFRTLVNQAPIGIAMVDADGCTLMSNPALQEFLGYSEELLRQFPISQLLIRDQQDAPPFNWDELQAELPDGATTERQFSRSDGTQVWGSLTVSALPDFDTAAMASLLMLQDISDRKQAEDRSRHLQKMEAIGHLTGGVAHDFNNLLAVISGNLELLGSELKNTPLAEMAENAAIAADRGAQLTRQLLVFGRRAPLRPGIIDLNQAIDHWQHLLHRTIPASIRIEFSQPSHALHANVDQAELENALLNLALNARDAMPDGGCLTIETRLIREQDLPDELNLQPNDHISILFRDTGCGMDDSVQDRAFDPFFTTKRSGAGTGLGLSMVYGFIRQSGGQVVIHSQPQEGTTVELLLPCAQLPEEESNGRPSTRPKLPGGGDGEIILVVEDNDNVRDVILRQLKMLGYETVHATCRSAALEIIRGPDHLDLLLTDMVMPGELQGPQLVAESRTLRPNMSVMLMSGYADQVTAKAVSGAATRLAKPFSIHDLATAVRQALQQHQ